MVRSLCDHCPIKTTRYLLSMNHLRAFCILSFSCCCFVCKAQILNTEGFITTLSGEKVMGDIYMRSGEKGTQEMLFLADGVEKKYGPGEIQGFGFSRGGYFAGNVLEGAFIEQIVSGPISAYQFKRLFIVATADDTLYLSEAKRKIDVGNRDAVASSTLWKGSLAVMMADCPAAANRIQGMGLQRKDLIKLIQVYSDCQGAEASALEERGFKKMQLSVMAGGMMTPQRFPDRRSARRDDLGITGFGPMIGGAFNYWFHREYGLEVTPQFYYTSGSRDETVSSSQTRTITRFLSTEGTYLLLPVSFAIRKIDYRRIWQVNIGYSTELLIAEKSREEATTTTPITQDRDNVTITIIDLNPDQPKRSSGFMTSIGMKQLLPGMAIGGRIGSFLQFERPNPSLNRQSLEARLFIAATVTF